jgi:hypothetical protein
MPKVYRSMRADGEQPELGSSAACLGVRDIDLPVAMNGYVYPSQGGMSVAPTWRDLPSWRIPVRLKKFVSKASGSNQLRCWRLGTGPFQDGEIAETLVLRVDGAKHGLIEPQVPMPIGAYLDRIAATRLQWVIDEE